MKIVGMLIAAAGLAACLASTPAQPAPLSELREHLATHLIGKTIENQDALELGKLRDFILEADTGKPLYGVVSSGGIAGLKARRRLVPAPALSLASAKRSVLYMDVPFKKWAEAPGFTKSDLANLSKNENLRRIYDFYGVTFGDLPIAEPSGKPGAARLSRTGQEPNVPTRNGNVERASELIGQTVFDSHLQKLGNITDLLLDVSGTRPTMAIISSRSLLKTSECFAVPFRALARSKEDKLLVSCTRESLQHAVLLNERTWPQAAARDGLFRCPAR